MTEAFDHRKLCDDIYREILNTSSNKQNEMLTWKGTKS